MGKVTIDLVSERPDGALVLILVEQGPWLPERAKSELHRVQQRLFDCVEAAVDGVIAQRFPQSKAGVVVIRLDYYEIARAPVEELFTAFRDHVSTWKELQDDIARKGMVSRLEFELKNSGDA